MNLDIRPLTAKEIPALLPLVEQYWLFEDIPAFDPARVGRELERACADPELASGWIAFARERGCRLPARGIRLQPRAPRPHRRDRRVLRAAFRARQRPRRRLAAAARRPSSCGAVARTSRCSSAAATTARACSTVRTATMNAWASSCSTRCCRTVDRRRRRDDGQSEDPAGRGTATSTRWRRCSTPTGSSTRCRRTSR